MMKLNNYWRSEAKQTTWNWYSYMAKRRNNNCIQRKDLPFPGNIPWFCLYLHHGAKGLIPRNSRMIKMQKARQDSCWTITTTGFSPSPSPVLKTCTPELGPFSTNFVSYPTLLVHLFFTESCTHFRWPKIHGQIWLI